MDFPYNIDESGIQLDPKALRILLKITVRQCTTPVVPPTIINEA